LLGWAAIEIRHPARSVQDTAEKIVELATRNERRPREILQKGDDVRAPNA
jgi:hypothetical protein